MRASPASDTRLPERSHPLAVLKSMWYGPWHTSLRETLNLYRSQVISNRWPRLSSAGVQDPEASLRTGALWVCLVQLNEKPRGLHAFRSILRFSQQRTGLMTGKFVIRCRPVLISKGPFQHAVIQRSADVKPLFTGPAQFLRPSASLFVPSGVVGFAWFGRRERSVRPDGRACGCGSWSGSLCVGHTVT